MAMKLRQMTMNLVIHLDHACQRTVDDHLMVLNGVRETPIQVYKSLPSTALRSTSAVPRPQPIPNAHHDLGQHARQKVAP